MRRFTLSALIAFALVALYAGDTSAAPGRGGNVRIGLGGSLGDPIGPSLKLFLAPQHALQFEFGYGQFVFPVLQVGQACSVMLLRCFASNTVTILQAVVHSESHDTHEDRQQDNGEKR